MTEAFQKTLTDDILKKLEKLDTTEEAVNNLRTSFKKLEGRIESLEHAQATTKRDVEDLEESLNSNEKNKNDISDSLKELKEETESRFATLEKENSELRISLKGIRE